MAAARKFIAGFALPRPKDVRYTCGPLRHDVAEEDGMTQPLVSVLIPTYNRAHLLPRAIRSVLDQTYRALEVLVVDDGSTDDTRAVVAEFSRADGRVQYVCRENGGVSAARNTGIQDGKSTRLNSSHG